MNSKFLQSLGITPILMKQGFRILTKTIEMGAIAFSSTRYDTAKVVIVRDWDLIPGEDSGNAKSYSGCIGVEFYRGNRMVTRVEYTIMFGGAKGDDMIAPVEPPRPPVGPLAEVDPLLEGR